MSARVEIIAGWEGEHFIPLRRYAKICDEAFTIGERYLVSAEPLATPKNRRHYFAVINELFASWPENYPRQFHTPDHMRKWALIRCGFRKERQFAAASPAEARRLAAFMHEGDEYAEIAIHEHVIVEWTALSQKQHAMGREQFSKSKADVLAFLAEQVGVTVESLAPPREEPPPPENDR